jgi:hypothetical protein
MKDLGRTTAFFVSALVIYTIVSHLLTIAFSSNFVIVNPIWCLFDRIVFSLWLGLFFLALVYPVVKNRQGKALLILSVVFSLLLMLAGERLRKAHQLVNSFYASVKQPHIYLNHDFFISDSSLGYLPEPGVSGQYEIYSDGQLRKVVSPVSVDLLGGRSWITNPVGEASGLFLGCSYTWGDLLADDETWPALVSEELGFTRSFNAGLPGGGLSQMLIRQDRALKRRGYTFCFIEAASWLGKRSASPYAPMAHGLRPVPYITFDEEKIEYRIVSPLFESPVWELPIHTYRETEQGLADWWSFYRNIGWPGVYGTIFKKPLIKFKMLMGSVPEPVQDVDALNTFAYSQLAWKSLNAGSWPVIVNLGAQGYPELSREQVKKFIGPDLWEHCIYVPADSILKARHPDDYAEAYHHWVEVDGEMIEVDGHPNAQAAREIAALVVRAIDEKFEWEGD